MTREMWEGNQAIAEAAVRAGLEAYFGYPITPQTEALEYLSKRMPELGRTFVQAESELAAINMVYGSASAGTWSISCSATRSSQFGSSTPRRSTWGLASTSRAPSSPCSCTAGGCT